MANVTSVKKAEKVREEDYIYLSAMVRTRENRRISYDALLRMADAKDLSEMLKMLPEYSIEPIYSENGAFARYEHLSADPHFLCQIARHRIARKLRLPLYALHCVLQDILGRRRAVYDKAPLESPHPASCLARREKGRGEKRK